MSGYNAKAPAWIQGLTSTLTARYPTITDILAAISSRHSIFQAKLNHGFWESWMEVDRRIDQGGYITRAELDQLICRRYFADGGFLDEMKEELRAWRQPPVGPYLSCSSQAFPGDEFLAPLPETPRQHIDAFIQRNAPPFSVGVDGLVWKRAVLDGSIADFMRQLRCVTVIMVGPDHLRAHQACWGWTKFDFVDIHPTEARGQRNSILKSILRVVSAAEFPVVLLQCGSLSAWLVARLHRNGINAAVLDLGRALDFIVPDVIVAQPWGAAHIESLAANFCAEVPAWEDWRRRVNAPIPAVHTNELATVPDTPVPFVERKSIDFDLFEKSLRVSARTGHWANRGPAVEALEAEIESRLDLHDRVAALVVSSGTAALWVAAAIAELEFESAIRWVVSSFGFFSTTIGPLNRARVLDCDSTGMLSFEELESLDPESYDGIVLTDLFGRSDVSPYLDFARRHGKKLIIDAAPAFDRAIYCRTEVPVAFSFHHTKPYGFGEGGCVLLPRAVIEVARSASNFGHDLPDHVAPYSGNWKLSDIQAAAIAQRHSSAPYWEPQYRLQYLRIKQIAQSEGIELVPAAGHIRDGRALATPAYLALVLDGKISQTALSGADIPFVARKYYRPLAPTANATDLYQRIVCVPTHKDMSTIDSDQIKRGLSVIRELQENEV